MADIEGLDAFHRRVAAIPRDIRAAIQPALDKAAREAVGEMKKLAPSDEGELRESIRVEPGGHELSRRIIAGDESSPQATFIEFGTAKMEAKPFFWLVIRALRRRSAGQISRAANKAVRKFSS